MLSLILLLLALVAIVADAIYLRRLKEVPVLCRRLFAVFAVVTNLLPLVAAVWGFLARDNTPVYMSVVLWLFWCWMITVLPRLVYYLFVMVRLRWVGIVAGVGVIALFVWGLTAGRTTIRVSRVELCSERLPSGFDGYRIAQFSDAHIGTLINPDRELGRIVDSINALRPDLVVFTGDLVNIRYTELDARAQRLLSRIEAPVMSVTGNHDVGGYIKDSLAMPRGVNIAGLLERQRAMGWQVLMDTTCYLHRGGDSISLSGIAYDTQIYHRRHDSSLPPANLAAVYRGVPDSLYNITLAHLPQLWEQITQSGYGDLTLAGHVHSMQFKLRLFGRDFSPAQWLYDRWSGLYQANGRMLYINDGTGYVAYPMRLGAYPEITLFTLRRCK